MGGTKVLDRAAMAVRPGEIVAVIDASGSGGENLAEAISRLIKPESGQINIGNEDIGQMLEAVTGRRFAYAASDAYMFQASMRDNLLYGLKHAPVRVKVYEGDQLKARHWEMREAEIVGNPQDVRYSQRLGRLRCNQCQGTRTVPCPGSAAGDGNRGPVAGCVRSRSTIGIRRWNAIPRSASG